MDKAKKVNLKKILGDPDLRRKLMVSTIQATQAREGIATSDEQADRAYYVVTEGEKTAFFDLEQFRGKSKSEIDRREEMFVRSLQSDESKIRFDVARRDFSTIEGSPIIYRRVGIVSHIFRENTSVDPSWGKALQGMATAADKRFVRYWWEVDKKNIRQEKDWIPFAKGGDFCRFYSDINLVVFWKNDGLAIKNYSKSYVRNETYYYKLGLTWPLRTQRGFNLRYMPSGCIFGHKGPVIIPKDESSTYFLLGIGNSRAAEFILHGLISFGSYEVGAIKRLPIPKPSYEKKNQITKLSKSIYHSKRLWDFGNELCTNFQLPWILRKDLVNQNESISNRLRALNDFENMEDINIQKSYTTLNDQTYSLYNIPSTTIEVIERTLGTRPIETIWPQMEGKSIKQKRMEHIWRLLSYTVKCVIESDPDGILPLTDSNGKLTLIDLVRQKLSELMPSNDINQVEVEINNELKNKVKGFRKSSNIEQWLDNVFFDYHTTLYKKRPIFWHIASSQGTKPAAFSVMVHYHRFDKDRMAKLRSQYITGVIRMLKREAGLASQEGRTEDRIEWQSRLEKVENLDQKLQLIQEGAHSGEKGGEKDFRILTPWKPDKERPIGWDPDINDGVAINIGPFQKAGVLRISKVL